MKSKFLSALLAALLCLSLIVPAFADPVEAHFVIDELSVLTEDEYNDLKAYGLSLYEQTGVGVFFAYVLPEDLSSFDITLLTGGMEDCVIMLENATHWMMYLGGKGLQIDAAAEDALRAAYDAETTYAGGVRAFMTAASQYFADAAAPDAAPVPTGPTLPDAGDAPVIDEADLLTDAEEAALERKLAALSDAYGAQVVVCTVASTQGQDIDAYQNNVYDALGLGYGENRDGIMLLLGMDIRQYGILSNGFAGIALDDSAIDSIGILITPDLSAGNYAAAFGTFADQCEHYLDGYLNGFPFNFIKNLAIALAVGIVAGLIVAFVLKGQLKTVRKQEQAHVYVKPGSMQVTINSDRFLHQHVSRTRKESKSSSGSSGSSRSSGSGSF